MASQQSLNRNLTIFAQDPSIKSQGKIIRTRIEVPAEEIGAGPIGYRVHVIDYDSSTGTLYQPIEYPPLKINRDYDPFENKSDEELLYDPNFHQQNVYAIVMRTLAYFEKSLGRRVSWGFGSHQIKVAPHAFADANAFYSRQHRALLFGYFPARRRERRSSGRQRMVWSCLSHDVIAHETTHALLDGLRERFMDPSSPEQAGFHEGFADVVALLSVFSQRNVVKTIIDLRSLKRRAGQIYSQDLTIQVLKDSLLTGIGKEMGTEMSGVRGDVLRRSVKLEPSPKYIKESGEYKEPHKRGEILVAAVINAFLAVWTKRLNALGQNGDGYLDRDRAVEEGSTAADYLLVMVIRAIDYAPPVNLEFCDFLSAILTSDSEINHGDSKYSFRETLKECFGSYGITPAKGAKKNNGKWNPPDGKINYDGTHFESMKHDPDEIFRFMWDNRRALRLYEGAYTQVLSVRPCMRIGPDGFALRETVAEYLQILDLRASELKSLQIAVPRGMPRSQNVRLYGGGSLIFDDYGRLKFHVRNRLNDRERQTQRIEYLWDYGFFRKGASSLRSFSYLHRQRAASLPNEAVEEW